MKLTLSTILDVPPTQLWAEVTASRRLGHVAAPLASFEPIDPPALPPIWREGRYLVRLRLFGWLAAGKHWIVISYPPGDATPGAERFELRDNGHGGVAATWDHLIRLRALPDGRTLYADLVEVRAGLLTPLVWLFAQVFYRHRQRRWRRLAARGFPA
ncbi:MAG TPA: hypothetical protein VGE07_06925 [Herpetosiphonaceae bacterium]